MKNRFQIQLGGGTGFNRPPSMGFGNSAEVKKIGDTGEHQKDGVYDPNGISTTLLSSHYKQPIQIIERTEQSE